MKYQKIVKIIKQVSEKNGHEKKSNKFSSHDRGFYPYKDENKKTSPKGRF
ncbi:hypothetical protein NT98_1207 [Bacillus cereus]|uniref:Uncharacterized protein n=1 Tax=Bacillus cereus 03BB108 TaxID=451709 RepID=A0AAN0SYT2_BACCE|nr:hypothetical protein NT98_1207 [Bacillus cereus]AJI12184.1 hypothetical protein AK40_2820 [Bacillus cereus 03BB108]EAL13807.1 hypothetical protein protein [Bacillus cereus G9241]EDX61520.1 hypothetical protein BC03BB108_4155 [Bacillus cereus 03BB108]